LDDISIFPCHEFPYTLDFCSLLPQLKCTREVSVPDAPLERPSFSCGRATSYAGGVDFGARAKCRQPSATQVNFVGTFVNPSGSPLGRNATSFEKWRNTMFMKILAASALTVGLATSAMAQSADGGGSGKSVVVTPDPADPNAVDPSATYSTNGMNGALNSNADENCAASPQGAQPDANAKSPGTVSPTVNDNHCGK
jgi:hypothetical protein